MTAKPDLRQTVRAVRFASVLIVGPCLLIDGFVAWTAAFYFDVLDQTMMLLAAVVAVMIPFHGLRLWPEAGAEPLKPPPPVGIWMHVIPRFVFVPLGTIFAVVAWSRGPALVALGVGVVVSAVLWPTWRRMTHVVEGRIPTLIRS